MEPSPQSLAARPRGRTLQIAALVMLLAVLGWRAHSCHQQVEAKRRAVAEHNARLETRIASEPPPLPLDPYARRAAMADGLRLRPDRRFLLAGTQIRGLTGGQGGPAIEARFEGGKWKLLAGSESLGEVPELPDYSDLMAPMIALARRQLLASPVQGTAPVSGDYALQWEPDARAALPAQLDRWNHGSRTSVTLHLAARAAASLCFYEVDAMEADDALAARAIALVALDAAAGKAETAGEQAVLASALGYGRAARDLGSRLSGDRSLRYFLAGDDGKLRESALLREARAPDRYLRLRRAVQRNDEQDTNEFLDSDHGTERLDLAVLMLLLRERQMEHFAPVAFALPIFVLAAAERVPVQAPTQDRQSETVRQAVASTAARLRLQGDSLWQRLESALATQDPDTRGYLRAAWLSALRRQGEYLADSQGNRDRAASFIDALAKESSPTVQFFRGWFGARTSSDPAQALASLEKQEEVRGTAASGVVTFAAERADFADPKLLRGIRALTPRLDSRVSHRAALGSIAWSPLQDLRVSEKMLRSAFDADPDGEQQLREWFADLAGDARQLERIGRDRFALRHVRTDAWEHLWNLGGKNAVTAEKGLRAMLDEDPDDDDALFTLGRQFRLAGRLEDARAVMLAWLRHNDSPDVRAANVRGALARYSYLAKRYAEGLEMVEPALQVGNSSAYEYAALNLAGLGRGEQARQMVDILLKRYPYVAEVAIATEVEWVLGDVDAAGRRLAHPPLRLTATDYRTEVSEPFTRLFGKQPERAAAAATAAARAGVEPLHLMQLAAALEQDGQAETAFRVLNAIPVQGARADLIRLSAARLLRKTRGEDAARAWLHQQIPSGDEVRRGELALLGFQEGVRDAAWYVVPDPQGTGHTAEMIWMLRAASVALQGAAAPAAQREALRDYYATVRQPSRHSQIGRYLIGDVAAAEVAKMVTDLPATCEVPYYFGVRAQGEKRWGDAADWYRVAMECGLRHEAEYTFAWDELYRLRGEKNIFARLR